MQLLVTEDDPVLGAFLRKGLAIEGYQVDLALSGEACLAQLGSHPYDLLLLDLTLPDMDGAEVLRRMEGLGTKPSILVLTGRTQLEERIRSFGGTHPEPSEAKRHLVGHPRRPDPEGVRAAGNLDATPRRLLLARGTSATGMAGRCGQRWRCAGRVHQLSSPQAGDRRERGGTR